MVTVDAGEGTFPLVFLLDSDLERFDDRDALYEVEDYVRFLGVTSFNSLLEDFLLFTTITDECCLSSRLEYKRLRHADDLLFDDERLRAEGE